MIGALHAYLVLFFGSFASFGRAALLSGPVFLAPTFPLAVHPFFSRLPVPALSPIVSSLFGSTSRFSREDPEFLERCLNRCSHLHMLQSVI